LNTTATIRAELDRWIARGRIPGIQYTVVHNDEIRFDYQTGFADLSLDRRVLPETTFMASSSTKVVTATAIMQLVEQEKVLLDKPLTAYCSSHPYGDRLTIRQLLSQTAGIPNPLPLKWVHLIREHDRFDESGSLRMAMHRDSKLKFTPGERYSYSNISYWLLGKVIESVSGISFPDYVRKHVFDPLHIPAAAASFRVEDLNSHATGYQRRFCAQGLLLYLLMDRRILGETVKGHFSMLPVYMNGPAYGGLICTATGFALFLRDVLKPTPTLLSPRTRDLFLTEQTTSSAASTGMTLGWRIGRLENETYYGKPGGGPGFRSNVRIYPRLRLGVSWLANETGINARQADSISDSVDRHWLR
jgi:CubicO group peptidase (beta-lactamase class C family)